MVATVLVVIIEVVEKTKLLRGRFSPLRHLTVVKALIVVAFKIQKMHRIPANPIR